MGIFNMFKKDQKTTEMTPIKAVAVSLLYVMQSDGEFDLEEVGHLLAVLGGKKTKGIIKVGGQADNFLDECIEYTQTVSIDAFLNETKDILTAAQKLFIIVNMIDSSLSDGTAEEREELLIEEFIKAWNVDVETLVPIYSIISLKNDREIFKDNNYVKNKPDFEFKLKI